MSIIEGTKEADILIGDKYYFNLINGHGGDDHLFAGKLGDALLGVSGSDELVGGAGNDYLSGGTSADAMRGTEGNDVIVGGEGDDFASGGKGDDFITGGKGDDYILGNSDNDVLLGNSGNDHLEGNSGDDILDGGAGTDDISGGSGADVVIASTGNDVVSGGSGFDTIDFHNIAGKIEIDLSKHTASFGHGANANVQTISGFEQIVGNDFGNHFMGDHGNNAFIGGAGDDWFRGNGGLDNFTGGDGKDTFVWLKKDVLDGATDKVSDFHLGEDKLDLSDFLKGHKDPNEVLKIVGDFDGTVIMGNVQGHWVDIVGLDNINPHSVGADHHQLTLHELGILA